MAYFHGIVVILILLTWLRFSACLKDIDHEPPRFKKIVEDFEDYLKDVVSSEPEVDENLENNDAIEITDLEDSSEFFADYSDNNEGPEFDTVMQNLAHRRPNTREHVEAYDEEESNDKSSVENDDKETPDTSPAKQWQEEILYIKRSDSEQNEPISDVIEKILHASPDGAKTAHDSSKYKVHERDTEASSDQVNPGYQPPSQTNSKDFQFEEINAETAFDNGGSTGEQTHNHRYDERLGSEVMDSEAEFDDVCLKENFVANTHQTCTAGPEYELNFRSQFSDFLKEDMEKMLPQNYRENKSDYVENLGPGSSVEDRALCPFEWSISSRNPSRVPEYLYEAKCLREKPRSVSKNAQGKFYCKEMKRLVPVLWIVGCSNGKKKYKQGWQQVAVSCTPREMRKAEKQNIEKMH